MLPFRLSFGRDGARVDIDSIVSQRVGVYRLSFEGVALDSRFLPPSWVADPRWRVIVLVVRGRMEIDQASLGEGGGFVASTGFLVPGPEAGRWRVLPGSEVLAIRVEPALCAGPYRGRCDWLPGGWGALAREVARSMASTPPRPEEASEQAERLGLRLRELGALGGALPGLVSQGDPRAMRAARALFPVLSGLVSRPTLIDLIARTGTTERQFFRDIVRFQEHFQLFDRGWRAVVLRWRLTTASMLLSSPGLSLAEVAALAGYSGAKVMVRAFADAGMEHPASIRQALVPGALAGSGAPGG